MSETDKPPAEKTIKDRVSGKIKSLKRLEKEARKSGAILLSMGVVCLGIGAFLPNDEVATKGAYEVVKDAYNHNGAQISRDINNANFFTFVDDITGDVLMILGGVGIYFGVNNLAESSKYMHERISWESSLSSEERLSNE
jgi:hypothetical protein